MSIIPPSHREGLFGSDSYERISQRIRVRQDSAANWLKNDPVLESGEFGYEVGYPSGRLKIGTGSTRWSQLPYTMGRGPAGPAGPPGPMGPPGPAGGVTFSQSTTPPPNPKEGDLWLDGDQVLNVWDGSKWIAVTATSASSTNIVSTVEPAPGKNEGDLWINPDGTTTQTGLFSNANPPVYTDTPATESGGEPLGIVGGVYIEPDVLGGVPVVVAGRRYLMPLIAAPAGSDNRTPLFTFSEGPVRQQLDGGWLGLDGTGLNYYQPEVVGGVPVVIAGKRYLLPIMAE